MVKEEETVSKVYSVCQWRFELKFRQYSEVSNKTAHIHTFSECQYKRHSALYKQWCSPNMDVNAIKHLVGESLKLLKIAAKNPAVFFCLHH